MNAVNQKKYPADVVEKLFAVVANLFIALSIFYYFVEESSRHSVETMASVVKYVAIFLFLCCLIRAIMGGALLSEEIAFQRLKSLVYGMLPAMVMLLVMIPVSFIISVVGGSLIVFFLGPVAPIFTGVVYLMILAVLLLVMEICVLPGAVCGIQLLRGLYRRERLGMKMSVCYALLLLIPFANVVDVVILSKLYEKKVEK